MPDDGRTRTSGRGAAGSAAQPERQSGTDERRTSLPSRTDWTGGRTDADVRGGQALSRLMD